ncbi:hypothetical protein [uncultured Thiothrix sp.]|uniref:hypothetical protein n=1 Tax=uncultured Thiothrix sp. TaxID=223185 RepID=UPI002603755C|nr:hypothetical protein [uncultured Thiothrix sp.]
MFKFSRDLIALSALFSSTAALAHPGQHGALGWSELAEHLVSSPYHSIGLFAVGALITAVVVWRVKRS